MRKDPIKHSEVTDEGRQQMSTSSLLTYPREQAHLHRHAYVHARMCTHTSHKQNPDFELFLNIYIAVIVWINKEERVEEKGGGRSRKTKSAFLSSLLISFPSPYLQIPSLPPILFSS